MRIERKGGFQILQQSREFARLLAAGRWSGVEFQAKEQDVSHLTTWTITGHHHTVVVHLDGPIHRLETELSGVGALHDPPMAGEVWLVPSGVRYSSLARGGVVRYAELSLPPATELRAVAGHYDGFLLHSATRLERLVCQPDDLSALQAEELVESLAAYVAREFSAPAMLNAVRELTPSGERRLAEHIQANLAEPITLRQLSCLAGMTTHQLLPAFRRSFGATPAQYVIGQRLRRARWLLQSTKTDITRIAMETGFASHGHLTTAFRHRIGVTPTAYRAGARPSSPSRRP